jgi:hypothetical protein
MIRLAIHDVIAWNLTRRERQVHDVGHLFRRRSTRRSRGKEEERKRKEERKRDRATMQQCRIVTLDLISSGGFLAPKESQCCLRNGEKEKQPAPDKDESDIRPPSSQAVNMS